MNPKRLLSLGLLSLIIVALLGVIMRYKIGFSFPIVNQKHLQLAHSGFAFSGLITHFLLTFILIVIHDSLKAGQLKFLTRTIHTNLFFSYVACIAFIWQGFGMIAIIAQLMSFIAVLLFVVLGLLSGQQCKVPPCAGLKWGGYYFWFR